mgnify:FL=1|jgi:hypothetical protein|tara:strand:+ start:465 stop:671 length:207 start_codon:yes stop_codon:yes gene_type:complete
MKWALIILYFIGGPDGGWYESERKFFQTEKECIEHMEFFNNMPKPGVMMSRCHDLNEKEWWKIKGGTI